MLLIINKIYATNGQYGDSCVSVHELLSYINDHVDAPISERTLQRDGEGILVSQLANGKSRYVMLLNRSIDNTQNITFYLGESVKRITPFNGEEKLNAGRQTVTLTPGNYAIYKIK